MPPQALFKGCLLKQYQSIHVAAVNGVVYCTGIVKKSWLAWQQQQRCIPIERVEPPTTTKMGKGALGSLAVRALVLILSMALTDDPRAPLLSRNRIDEADNVSHNSADEAVSNTDYGSGVYRYPLYLQPGQFTSLEKLMFFVSSILLIFLCIFIGLYARSSFGDSLPSPVVPSPTTEPTPLPPPDKHYCLEPSCILASAHILQVSDMNYGFQATILTNIVGCELEYGPM